MPTYLVTISPGTPAIPVIGTDETDAIAGALQSLDSLRDVIALCADTVPEMAAVCERAAPRASAAQPWPEAAAIRAVVAWWMGRHPEIAVRPKMHPALQPLADAGTALGAVITAQTARIAPLSTCTWGTPHLPGGEIDVDRGTDIVLTFAEPADLGAWEEAAGIPVGRSGARPYGMRVASITLHEHQRLVEAGGMYGDGIVVASVTAPLAAGYAGACGAREYSGAHYSRRADGRIEFAVWG